MSILKKILLHTKPYCAVIMYIYNELTNIFKLNIKKNIKYNADMFSKPYKIKISM